ncbi:MAG: hypothetical protein Kilf2KO_14000 [Rhodospirillales bacterium]
MLDMVRDSSKLFFTGKLFQNNKEAMRQLAMGSGAGLVVMVVVGLLAPLWVAALAGGAVAGFLQPILFKDLKYA